MSVREFTLIVPYYRNSVMLREQLKVWEQYPPEVALILVDDGSPEDAYSVVEEVASPNLLKRIQLYRIQVDIPWNRGGARNLGVREARTEWIVHVDIDHVLPPDCARALLQFKANPRNWYRFDRFRNGKADDTRLKDRIPKQQAFGKIHPHMDSFLVTRRMFWDAGGYDEDYSGCLGGGSPFLKLLARQGPPLIAPPAIHLQVYTRSVAIDASDNTLSRDRNEYAARRRRKDAAGDTTAKNPIRFPWIKEELMYPKVIGEYDTIREIMKGKSIARFGDGELKVLDGKGYTRERTPVPKLTAELRAIAAKPDPGCLIGIPTMDPRGTKYENWKRHKARFCRYFNDEKGITYYSALITRPDCGEWLESREYYELVIQLWAGKRVVAVVSEPQSKLLTFVRTTNSVVHIECPMYEAYARIDSMEQQVVEAKPDIALLSVGVTATCLAHRLAARGIQAIDLGSIGGFLHRWKSGGPRPKNYAEERG